MKMRVLLSVLTCVLLLCAALAEPQQVTVTQILQERPLVESVVVNGQIVDAFPDETDARYNRLYLYDCKDMLDVVLLRSDFPLESLTTLLGDTVAITGRTSSQSDGFRQHCQPFFLAESIRRIESNEDDVTPLGKIDGLGLSAIRNLGRRRVVGKVLAVWQGNSALIETTSSGRIRVLLARSATPPSIGDCIEVIGLAQTDSVDFILTYANWKRTSSDFASEPSPIDFTADDLDGPRAHSNFNRANVRLRGRITYAPRRNSVNSTMLLECGHQTIRIDPGPCPDAFREMSANATVEVSGIGLCRIDPDTLDQPFVRFKEFQVVIRTPEDIRILSQPPWWTPRRLIAVIIILLSLLTGILVWNKFLRILIARRSLQLANEKFAHDKVALKFDERTRLAVELHDSLSQTLTGAAMEIRAAEQLKGNSLPDMLAHLSTASKTLQSCRDELRNCLWDLRSQTLEVPDMTTAILRTLEPHTNASRLRVRFNVPRCLFSDNFAHAILCVIRELVLNAIRHGHARTVRVAGSLDGNILQFSVSDDGCGFDPETCPGILQGHFGLQGIRERMRPFGGKLTLVSGNGRGTRASVTLKMPLTGNHPEP